MGVTDGGQNSPGNHLQGQARPGLRRADGLAPTCGLHQEWAAKISKKVGGAFSAHGGYVAGINLDLVENKRIVQAWRAKNWPKGVYSIVSFNFSKDGSGTKLTFDHTGIPDGMSDHLAGGWQKMYWDRLTEYFA